MGPTVHCNRLIVQKSVVVLEKLPLLLLVLLDHIVICVVPREKVIWNHYLMVTTN